jgi:TetR/AcrR family transcriptional repressor of mexJK operon
MATAAATSFVEAPTGRPEKTARILEAGRQLFIDQGFAAASMDQIAKLAGVSKATVYAHFENKEKLFAAIVYAGCKSNAEDIMSAVAEIDDMRVALTKIARNIEQFLLSPKVLGIYRVIISEGPRFPDLAKAFYESGPLPAKMILADYFRRASEKGLLNVPNPRLAAEQLVWLVRGPLYLRRFFNLPDGPGEPTVDQVIEGAVDTMLKTYGV